MPETKLIVNRLDIHKDGRSLPTVTFECMLNPNDPDTKKILADISQVVLDDRILPNLQFKITWDDSEPDKIFSEEQEEKPRYASNPKPKTPLSDI